MGDLISRQAAIDTTWEDPSYTDPLNVLSEVRDRIKALPSAQPEIIRCKDCKFWKKYGYINGKPEFLPKCGFNQIYTSKDDFCSRAERKNNG